jgi:antirestriction protein ArdC
MNAPKRSDSTSAALARIEHGIEEVKSSEQFRNYLAFSGRFHSYSVGNQILIWLQRPEAQMVAGFHAWLKMDRHVLKGEKGIMILAPVTVRRNSEPQGDNSEADDETAVFFKPAYVFDITQTEGAVLPSPVTHLTGSDTGLWEQLARIAAAEGLHVSRESRPSKSANGAYSRSERGIWVRPDLEPLQAVKTLAHELSHHFAKHDEKRHSRGEAEMIAESSAFVVMAFCGHDSGDYSFGYLATWGDTKLLRERLQDIHTTAEEIISRLSG